ncbi:hypothetical protein JCM21900_001937 [Sporobolomyces salmonicolor]
MASSRTPAPGASAASVSAAIPQPTTITRSMSRRSHTSTQLISATSMRVTETSSEGLSRPRISQGPAAASSSTLPRARSSTTIASRMSAVTGKVATTTLASGRTRRVLAETNHALPASGSSNKAVRQPSVSSFRSPSKGRRYSRAEAGGLTGMGVIRAGPKVVSPVKPEPHTASLNDPFSTAFVRPTFEFEASATRATAHGGSRAGEERKVRALPSDAAVEGTKRRMQLRIPREDSTIAEEDMVDGDDDVDELHLHSPHFNPFDVTSPSKRSTSPFKVSYFPPTSPSKRPRFEDTENAPMDVDDAMPDVPIQPSSPFRGALSPRSLLGPLSAASTATSDRSKTSRKLDEVESSSSGEDDIDFLSPRKKAKRPAPAASTTTTATRAPTRTSHPSRVSRARLSTHSESISKTADRPLLLRSPPAKKRLPSSAIIQAAAAGGPASSKPSASVPMQRAGARAFPLPLALAPAATPAPLQAEATSSALPRSTNTASAPSASSYLSAGAAIAPSATASPAPHALATSSNGIVRPPTTSTTMSSRLPRRVEHPTFPRAAPAPAPAAARLPPRSATPSFADHSLISIDESAEASVPASDISRISTTSTSSYSEETAKRLANLQSMLSRLQMPRQSTSGGGGSTAGSRRVSAEGIAGTGSRDYLVPIAPPAESGPARKVARRTSLPVASSSNSGTTTITATGQRRRSSVASRPIGGIINTGSTSGPLSQSTSSASASAGPFVPSTRPAARRISSSFLPSNASSFFSFDQPAASTSGAGLAESVGKPKSANVLQGVVAFVDVRTAEGDDSGMIFVDMLKGMGARVTTRPSSLTTHIVFKSGRPATLQFARSAPPSRTPYLVGIGWVVRCAELGTKAAEGPFRVVDEQEADERSGLGVSGGLGLSRGAGGAQKRRRSMEPKALAALNNASSLASNDAALKASIAASLERARRKTLQFAPKVGSPLAKRVWAMPDPEEDDQDYEP